MEKQNKRTIIPKKKIALLLTTLLTTMIPMTAFASGETAQKYERQVPHSIFGIAADFGVFAKESIEFTGHSDTNFATELLIGDNNIDAGKCNLTDAVSYASKWDSKNENANTFRGLDRFVIKEYSLNGEKKELTPEFIKNTLQRKVGENVDIQIEDEKVPFINLDQEFSMLKQISDVFSEVKSAIKYNENVNTYDFTNASLYNGYAFVNMTKEQFKNANELKIKLPKDINLIINVELGDTKQLSGLNSKLFLYNDENKNYEQLSGWTPGASRVVWNFHGNGGRIDTSSTLTAGMILAPNYDLYVGNHVGNVVCNKLVGNNGEVHYVRPDFPCYCD